MRVLFLLSFLFLIGCATKDYDAQYPVKGICRSCKPHMIKGIWYTPQLHYDYDETAIASWYGPGFHGKQKANGEIFDQDEISAAHKTLPLPTVVKVTNLENGKSVYLVVDDRGPYVDNRIIDLSKGAAKALGVYVKGTAKIRVQSIPAHSHALSMHLARIGNRWGAVKGRRWGDIYRQDIAGNHSDEPYEKGSSRNHPVPGHADNIPHSHKPHVEVIPLKLEKSIDDIIGDNIKTPLAAPVAKAAKTAVRHVTSTSAQKPTPSGPSYSIQLASFVKRENAAKLVGEIQGLAQATIKETVVPPGQIFHVVKCGPYPNKDAAEMALTSLSVFGYNAQLVRD